MTKPLPWSFTSLDTFKTCPFQYMNKYVAKTVREEPTEAMLWGNAVHKHFEDRQAVNTPLPVDLRQHEPYMQKLADKPGVAFTEQKIALDTKAQPTHFFDRDVWYRGVMDYQKVDSDSASALIVDYKTGKPHQKFTQLGMFAIHTFAHHHKVELVNAQFYWTKDQTVTKKVWSRKDIPELWGTVLPDLRQYAQAFKENVWQKRQSGLCRQWCPVLECEHNGRR